MYYRVKRFNERYQNMFVLDQDSSLAKLKLRTDIDCAGIGPKKFNNPSFIDSQRVKCIDLGGTERPSDIIEETFAK